MQELDGGTLNKELLFKAVTNIARKEENEIVIRWDIILIAEGIVVKNGRQKLKCLSNLVYFISTPYG